MYCFNSARLSTTLPFIQISSIKLSPLILMRTPLMQWFTYLPAQIRAITAFSQTLSAFAFSSVILKQPPFSLSGSSQSGLMPSLNIKYSLSTHSVSKVHSLILLGFFTYGKSCQNYLTVEKVYRGVWRSGYYFQGWLGSRIQNVNFPLSIVSQIIFWFLIVIFACFIIKICVDCWRNFNRKKCLAFKSFYWIPFVLKFSIDQNDSHKISQEAKCNILVRIYYESLSQNNNMNTELKESINSWPEWIAQFQFDPVYGYLIDPAYTPISFDFKTLHQVLSRLHEYNASQQIIEVVKNFPHVWIKPELANYRDMVIMHDMASYVIHSFVKITRDRKESEQDIVCPKNLAELLVQSASYLRIKTGMATGIGYNWYFKDHRVPENLDEMTIQDVQIKYYYSNDREHEGLFFKVSVVTSYLLGRIIKNCYELNCIITQQPNLIDEALARMKNIRYYLKRIWDVNMEIQRKMSKEFFFFTLRVFVAGYQELLFEGIDQRVSSSGGAGGYDPSFQSFERAFGVYFQDEIGNIQQKLRHGMPEQNLALIDFFSEHSIIRDYCECSQQLQVSYNQTLDAYARYLELHGTFIRNFILNMIPSHGGVKKKYGEHGEGIQRIMEKFKFVRGQEIHDQQQEHKQQSNTRYQPNEALSQIVSPVEDRQPQPQSKLQPSKQEKVKQQD